MTLHELEVVSDTVEPASWGDVCGDVIVVVASLPQAPLGIVLNAHVSYCSGEPFCLAHTSTE